jgi:putative tricarboxylic transport membrane protein
MDVLGLLMDGFAQVVQPQTLLFALLGCFLGTVVGVLPGLSPSTTIALLIPVALAIQPEAALVMMTAVYLGAMYGGTLTSVLLNVPGEPSSVMTALDGYQLARQGRAGTALSIAAIGSFIGGVLSVVGLMLLAVPLAGFAVGLGPAEYFAIMVLALVVTATMVGSSKLRAAIAILLGLMVATIGTDLQTGIPRFTFGQSYLLDGIDLIVPIIGLFGVGEVLWNIAHPEGTETGRLHISGRLWPTREDLKTSRMPILRGSVGGFFAGLLPGSGSVLGSFLTYSVEKRLSKHPERFGKGALEGVAAAETSNNSSTGGALVPMLTLGIPGSGTTAVLLAYLIMYGIDPGPRFFIENSELAWTVIAALFFSNFVLLILNLPLIPLFVKILDVPVRYLFPVIMMLALLAGYAVNNALFDAILVFIFGIIGYGMRKANLPSALLVIGLVLGTMIERDFRQAMLLANGDLIAVLTQPLALVFYGLAAVVLLFDITQGRRHRGRQSSLKQGRPSAESQE